MIKEPGPDGYSITFNEIVEDRAHDLFIALMTIVDDWVEINRERNPEEDHRINDFCIVAGTAILMKHVALSISRDPSEVIKHMASMADVIELSEHI